MNIFNFFLLQWQEALVCIDCKIDLHAKKTSVYD